MKYRAMASVIGCHIYYYYYYRHEDGVGQLDFRAFNAIHNPHLRVIDNNDVLRGQEITTGHGESAIIDGSSNLSISLCSNGHLNDQ